MKIAALDVGDRWTGVALSDPMGILASPRNTVKTTDLIPFLQTFLVQENVSTLVVGQPKTMRGTHSAQTEKVTEYARTLEKEFPSVTIKLWDERLSSQHAQRLKPAKTKQDKLQSHSIAAALILRSYLDHLQFKKIT